MRLRQCVGSENGLTMFAPNLEFVSTGVCDSLQLDVLARSIISLAYYVCCMNILELWCATMIPKK